MSSLFAASSADVPFPILSALVVTPFLGALLMLVLPNGRPEYFKQVAFLVSGAVAGMTAWVMVEFDKHTADEFQFAVASQLFMQSDRVTAHATFMQPHDGIENAMVCLTVEVVRPQHLDHIIKSFVGQQNTAQHSLLCFEILRGELTCKRLPRSTTLLHNNPFRNRVDFSSRRD